jgi:tetratricopeptide (TPR) repeat protein
MVLQASSGCGTAPLKKGSIPITNMVCDEKADEALKDRRYEKSIILHEFYLKENPENGLAMYHMGYSYGQLGDHENEVECYEKAINLGFYGSSIFFNLGMAYREMGMYEDSVRIFKKAMDIEPSMADNHFGLALAYQRMGSNDLAEMELKRAIKLDPKGVEAIYVLGVQYVETERIDEAESQLEKLIKIDPDNDMTQRLKMMLEDKK